MRTSSRPIVASTVALVLIFAGCGGTDDEIVAPSGDDQSPTTTDDTRHDDR